MVEAELGDGDIGQITQPIQNALRSPATPLTKRLVVKRPVNNETPDTEIETEIEEVDNVDDDDNAAPDATATPAKPRGPRKPPRTPNVVQIDMNADVSLSSFAKDKDASSQAKKYLIAAAWLKEHRGVDAVTADHIYTCFRSMSWPTNIPDFWQPLRDLKKNKYFSKNDQDEYEINHLGLDFVNKLGGSHGAG